MQAALDHHGLDVLALNGVWGEPVTWFPDTTMIADLVLPTPDPANIDIDAVHRLMSQDLSYGIDSAADDFEIDCDVIRLLLDEHSVPRGRYRLRHACEFIWE